MADFDLSRPYRTRSGQRAWAVRSPEPVGLGNAAILLGWVEDAASSDWPRYISAWDLEGKAVYSDSEADLVHVPDKRVGWINIYPKPRSDMVHASRETADLAAGDERIACVQIEYEVLSDE